MKAQDFRGFLEQLGDLTDVQRSALIERDGDRLTARRTMAQALRA